MTLTPLIRFRPITASALIRSNCDGTKAPWRIVRLGLRLAGDDVRTPDGRSINADWSIELHEGTERSERANEQNALGFLKWYPPLRDDETGIDDGESCISWAGLDEKMFSWIWELLLTGQLPESLTIGVGGIEYGWEPDGSSKIWDTSKAVPVRSLEFSQPFATRHGSITERTQPSPEAPISPRFDLEVAAEPLAQVRRRITVVGALLAAMLLVMLIR